MTLLSSHNGKEVRGMASMNTWCFTGRLGRDPELKAIPSGASVCSFSVAVDRFGDKPTVWVDVSVWGKAAESCAKYLTKGREVAITGQVEEVRAYAKNDGQPGASLSVSTRDVTFIGGRGDDSPKQMEAPVMAGAATGGVPFDPDEIPFAASVV